MTSRIRCSPGYFSVSPVLSIPRRSPILSPDFEPLPPGEGGVIQSSTVPLPLDGLVIQTIIAKWMGTLKEWTPHLERMSRRGYNMIHFTPLQQRGESNSPYSIFEQLEFSDDLFEQPGLSKDAKDEKMKEALAGIKKNYGMLGMIDVVLNHTANNSPWLEDHPEAGTFNSKGVVNHEPNLCYYSSRLQRHQLASPPRRRRARHRPHEPLRVPRIPWPPDAHRVHGGH